MTLLPDRRFLSGITTSLNLLQCQELVRCGLIFQIIGKTYLETDFNLKGFSHSKQYEPDSFLVPEVRDVTKHRHCLEHICQMTILRF